MKENFCNNEDSITNTITSTIFALVAQIERELISLSHARKSQGIKLGRAKGKGKSKLDEHKEDILKMLSYGEPKTLIAKQYGTSVGNLYNFLSKI